MAVGAWRRGSWCERIKGGLLSAVSPFLYVFAKFTEVLTAAIASTVNL